MNRSIGPGCLLGEEYDEASIFICIINVHLYLQMVNHFTSKHLSIPFPTQQDGQDLTLGGSNLGYNYRCRSNNERRNLELSRAYLNPSTIYDSARARVALPSLSVPVLSTMNKAIWVRGYQNAHCHAKTTRCLCYLELLVTDMYLDGEVRFSLKENGAALSARQSSRQRRIRGLARYVSTLM